IYLDSVAVFRDNPAAPRKELATSLNNLAALYLRQERWEAARAASAEAAGLRLAVLGPDHPHTASSQLAQALALNRLGQFTDAEALLRGVIANYHQQLGPAHWQSGNAKVYLGMVLTNLRRYTEAGIVLEEARHVLTDSLGADHYRTQNA